MLDSGKKNIHRNKNSFKKFSLFFFKLAITNGKFTTLNCGKLGGGFKYFLFPPLLGEDEPILTN